MINMVLIEKLGGAVAPAGLQRDPPLPDTPSLSQQNHYFNV